MAKTNRSRGSIPPIRTFHADGSEEVDSGIYSMTYKSFARVPDERNSPSRNAREALELQRDQLQEFVRARIPAASERQTRVVGVIVTLDLGDGAKAYVAPKDRETRVAISALQSIVTFLCGKPSNRAVENYLAGMNVGRLLERKDVLPHERDALKGKRQSKRNSATAKKRRLPSAEIRKRHQAVQDELAAQARRGERISRERAYRHVGVRMDISKERIKKAFLAVDAG